MFRLLSRTCPARLFALTLLAGSGAACGDEEKPNELSFRVSFACEADRTRSDLLRLRVIPGGCGAEGEPLYEAALARGEQAPAAGAIGPGSYGVEATAFAGEAVVAQGCSEVELPRAQAIELVLRSDTCLEEEPPLDAEAPLDAESDAGPELDADELDAEEAAQPADAEQADAPPRSCATDCSDSDPCTEDLCVDGECTNPAFSGARECDDIPCTQGDMCVEGECRPGAPNHAACADDGNACTAETCVAGTGCNRSNAGANGRGCDDGIECTSDDTCNDGICSGTDTCANPGEVCSAASHTCIACTSAQDCDDFNPCTNDVCGGDGKCTHPPNSATCNDGKSCTNNDTCAGGSCAGTSTCPGDATCGGSTCTCNDGSETLCNNKCVDLRSTASDCGICGRGCGNNGGVCQNSACKPASATTCTAHRNGGHDYLVCTDTLDWEDARDRCRSYGQVLAIIDSQSENDFLAANLGGAARWIGANDRGSERNCNKLSTEEGIWHWANANSDEGTQLCAFASFGATSCTPTDNRYVNWSSGNPNNANCGSCGFNCVTEGQDCASIDPNGSWDDDVCSTALGYICETP